MQKYSREELIERYENIIRKWDSCPRQTLKRLFPEKYEEICTKLQALKDVAEYHVVDLTKEYIAAGGVLVCGAQGLHGNKFNIHSKTKRYQDGLDKFINNFDQDGGISDIYFKWGRDAEKRAKDVIDGYILEERKYTYLVQCNGYRTEINKRVYSELINNTEEGSSCTLKQN